MIVAGGTDLLPNMKHELFTPRRCVVSLGGDRGAARHRARAPTGWLAIGAMTTLADVARDARRARARARRSRRRPASSPGRSCATMGTLGGNVLLDTRCHWYNQTYFWRAGARLLPEEGRHALPRRRGRHEVRRRGDQRHARRR